MQLSTSICKLSQARDLAGNTYFRHDTTVVIDINKLIDHGHEFIYIIDKVLTIGMIKLWATF
jgi:hypothetical protein